MMYSAIVTSILDKRKRFFQKEGKTCLDLGHFLFKMVTKHPRNPKHVVVEEGKRWGVGGVFQKTKTFSSRRKMQTS